LRHVRALTVSDEIRRLAYVVLWTLNRMQAKGSTVRIVVPRDPEVAYELGVDTDEDVIVTAVRYLLEQGYVVPAGIDLQRGAYTIAPAGLEWLEAGASGTPQDPREEPIEPSEGTEPPRRRIPRRFQRELIEARKRLDQELIGRPWWHRWFGSS
jgi:hypothetical protein